MAIEKEIWKDIKNFEGLYQVSNLGNIKNLLTNKSLSSNTKGYSSITLYKNKFRFNYNIHRLVAQAFIANPENKPQVNHKNGIKNDNRIENLEWCTAKENILHKHYVLNKEFSFLKNHSSKGKFGKEHYRSKKIGKYDLYGNIIETFNGISEASRFLKLNRRAINNCLIGRAKTSGGFIWKYL